MTMALFALFATFGLQKVAASQLEKERPVMKVVRLLQDMGAELQRDLDDDNAVHKKLDCWCKENDAAKKQAIEQGGAKVANLYSSLDEFTAKIAELKAKRKATSDELAADQRSLVEASALRMKQNKGFHGEEVDQMEAVAACKQAITVLGEHHATLTQVRSAARRLQDARVTQLVPSTVVLRADQLAALKRFMEPNGASAFLAVHQPASPVFSGYAPQSGQIFGILKQMQKDFEASLSDAQKAELKAQDEYKTLKALKEKEIAEGQQGIVDLDASLADFGEKHAQASQELEDTTEQLGIDQSFLGDLTAKCNEDQAEFEKRVKDRMDEIAAVQDTINILNSDDSFDAFDKSVNTALLQTSSRSEDSERRSRAAALLQNAAGQTGSVQLSALVATVKLDAFGKVNAEIDRLVEELGKQQQDEVAARDSCQSDLHSNAASNAAATDKKASLDARSADLEKTIMTLTSDIDATKAAVAESQTQMKRASETREAENQDFQQTVSDQRLTQTILGKAITRMKQVYAMLQQRQQPGAPHIQTSDSTDGRKVGNGPARFTKYEQNAGGSRAVAMLQTVLADSRKMEDEAIRSEQDSQSAYENFMQDSNKGLKKYSQTLTHLNEQNAKSKEALSMASEDRKETEEELAGLNKVLGDLKNSCDFLLRNFAARQEARAAEMQALRNAKAILAGMQ